MSGRAGSSAERKSLSVSRAREVDALTVGDLPTVQILDWDACLGSADGEAVESSITEFERRHRELNRLAAQAAPGGSLDQALVPILADQLLLGYVGAAEVYFRHLLKTFVQLCPETRGRISSVEIPFGSLEHYEADSIA